MNKVRGKQLCFMVVIIFAIIFLIASTYHGVIGYKENFQYIQHGFSKDFFLTDKNWVCGIARHWAGFFLPNTPQFIGKYKVGSIVKFKNGVSRKIIKIVPRGKYLNIYTDGSIFKFEDVGYPSSFDIISKK